MSRSDVGELRALVSKRRRGKRGQFPEHLRERLMAYAERRWSEGASMKTVATELGVSSHTLAYWRARLATIDAPLKAVRIVGDEKSGETVTVHGPRGTRVELSIEQAAELLRKLT